MKVFGANERFWYASRKQVGSFNFPRSKKFDNSVEADPMVSPSGSWHGVEKAIACRLFEIKCRVHGMHHHIVDT